MPRRPLQAMTASDLPCRLKLLRLQADLTCRGMARRLGVHPATVSHWERGRQPIRQVTAIAWLTVCRNRRQVQSRKARARDRARRPGPSGPLVD